MAEKFATMSISLPAASAMSKLVAPTKQKKDVSKVELSTLETIAQSLIKKNKINNDILKILPDLEFCSKTSTASILSPNDLTTKSIQIDFNNIVMGSELKGTIADTIKTDMENYYRVNEKISSWVEDSLFIEGANVQAYIPEASLHEVIGRVRNKNGNVNNGGYGNITIEGAIQELENTKVVNKLFKDSEVSIELVKSVINNNNKKTNLRKVKISPEEYTTESAIKKTINTKDLLNVEFIDNISLLFKNQLESKQVEEEIEKIYYKEEAGLDTKELNNLFITPEHYSKEEIITLKEYGDTKRESIGRPLLLDIPMEVCKPIWSGKPENHIGYLVLVDEKYNILANNERDFTSFSAGLVPTQYFNNTTSSKDNLINKAMEGLTKMSTDLPELRYIHDIYTDILHKTIESKLRESKFKDIGELGRDQQFLNVMFNRALEGKGTKILFLPKSMVSYFAYDYHSNGVGLSRMDKISVILSMRIIMMFAKLMANINNSIPRTTVTGTIDKDTPDVVKAMNDIIVGTAKYHQSSLPVGITNVNDILSWVQTAGYRYVFESELLPDTKIEYTQDSKSIQTPEDTISEMLEELSYVPFFMNRAMVQSGTETSFATTIVTQNKLYENRIVECQIQTEYLLAHRYKAILRNDNELRERIKNIISNNLNKIESLNKDMLKELGTDKKKKDKVITFLLNKFIDSLVIRLPRPSSFGEGDNLKDALESYKEVVEKYVEAVMSDDMLDASIIGEEVSEKIKSAREVIKKMLLIEWIDSNNHLPAMSNFLTLDEDGESNNNLLLKHLNYNKTLQKIFLDYYEKNEEERLKNDKKIHKIDEKMEKIREDEGIEDDENSSDSSDDSDNNYDDSDTDEEDISTEDTEDDGISPDEDEEVIEEEKEDNSTEQNSPDDDE